MNGEIDILKKSARIGFAMMAANGGTALERARRVAEDAKKYIQKQEGMSLFCMEDPILKPDDAARAASLFRRSEIDALVILHGTHSPAMLSAEIVRDLNVPLAIWGVPEPADTAPYAAGSMMGLLAHAAALTSLQRNFAFAYGMPDSEEARREIARFMNAVSVRQALRRAKIAILGSPAFGEQTGGADELAVKQVFGCEIRHLSPFDVDKRLEVVSNEDIENEILKLQREDYEFAFTDNTVLSKACAALIAVRKCMVDKRIAALATRCQPQLIQDYRYSPCFINAMLTESGLPSACDADSNGLIMMLIQYLYAGRLPFYGNWVQRDEKNNTVLYWNAGSTAPTLVNPRFQPKLTDSHHGPDNIAFDFPLKTGDVTLSSLLYTQGRYKLLIAGGRAMEYSTRTKGNYISVRFEAPVRRLLDIILEHGFTQQYCIVHDDIEEDLAEFARQLNIEVIIHREGH